MVRDLFDYREDGMLVRRVTTSSRAKGASTVGWADGQGYLRVRFAGKTYKVHRLVWLWHHGYLPEHGLDHINQTREDNRIQNLREVSRSCNRKNTGTPCNSLSGIKGVRWHKASGKWSAQIAINRKAVYLGVHDDFTEAVCHRLAAEQAEGWAGCDSSSPAFQYVKRHIPHIR